MNAKSIEPGQRFGRWTVIEKSDKRRHEQVMWLCRCDCGTESLVHAYSLKSGRSTSCGCITVEKNQASRKDLTAQKFGRLTVISPLPNQRWLCECECGKRVSVYTQQLRRGKTRSCGCIRVERFSAMEDERKLGDEAVKNMSVDGTVIYAIRDKRKLNCNSKTGIKGVCICNRTGKYRAYINLRRTHYELGLFNTLDDAVAARKEAEQKFYKPVIEAWEKGNL